MLKQYIAAGFDPARFWDLTPRLYAVEMDGAAERHRIERSNVWLGAMLPYMKKAPSYAEFVDPPKRRDRQSPEVMNAMLSALAAAWGAERVH